MAQVPISIYPNRQSALGNFGNALSGLGQTAMGFSSLMQQQEDKKKMDAFSALVSKKLMEMSDQSDSSNMLSQPGDIATIENAKLPDPSETSLEPNGKVTSALAPPEPPSSIEKGLVSRSGDSSAPEPPPAPPVSAPQSALTPSHPPTMAARSPIDAVGANNLNVEPGLEGQEALVNPAILQRASQMGMQNLIKTTPSDVYQKVLKVYREIAAAAAQAGHPEWALHFMDKQLDFLKNEYGSDTSLSKAVIQALLQGQNQKDVANINAGGKTEAAKIGAEASNYRADQVLAGKKMGIANKPTPGVPTQKDDEKTWGDFVNTASGVKGSARSNLGLSARKAKLAGDGLRIISMIKGGKIPASSNVESELATVLAATTSGGPQPSENLINDFKIKTGQKDWAGVVQYATAHPQEAVSKDVLDTYETQLQGQHDYWNEDVLNTIGSDRTVLDGIISRNPKYQKRYDEFIGRLSSHAKTQGNPNVNPGDSGSSDTSGWMYNKDLKQMRSPTGKTRAATPEEIAAHGG